MSLLTSSALISSQANSKFSIYTQSTESPPTHSNANNSIAYSPSLNRYVLVDNFGGIYTSTDLITWTSRTNPDPNLNSLWDIVWGNNIFVAVGSAIILTSPDGITWTVRTSNTTETLYAIAYNPANTTYVTVGSAGTIRSSTNATTWSTRNGGTTNSLYDVAVSSGGLFVAVGDVGTITTASAVNSWTVRTSNTTDLIFSVTAIGTNFVGVTNTGNTVNSTNGTTGWTVNTGITDRSFIGIPIALASSSALGLYVLITNSEEIFTSTNGLTWTTRIQVQSVSPLSNQVVFTNSRFIIVGGSKIYTSINGILWKPVKNTVQLRGSPAHSPTLDTTVVVGEFGYIFTQTSNGPWQTIDNINTTATLLSVIWSSSKNLFIAVGTAGTIITSSNGTTWQIQSSGTLEDLVCIHESLVNGTLIVGGKNTTLLTSIDGTNWTNASVSTTNTTYTINSISSSSSVNIATYYNPVNNKLFYLSSSNSTSWSESSVKKLADSPCEVKWDGEKFIGIGFAEYHIYSYNGSTWYTSGSFFVDSIEKLASGRLIAVGNDGAIITSIDGGEVWQILPQVTTNNLTKIISIGQKLVAIGSNGTVITSVDGINWNISTTGVTENLLDIMHISSNSLTLVIGNNNTIISSSNSGDTWSSISGPIAGHNLISFAINTNTNTVILVAKNISFSKLILYKTINFGTNWTSIYVQNKDQNLFGTEYSSIIYAKDKFILSSENEQILESSDDGVNWSFASKTYGVRNIVYYAKEDIFLGQYAGALVTSKNLNSWPTNGSTNKLNATIAKVIGVIDTKIYICISYGGISGALYASNNSTNTFNSLNKVYRFNELSSFTVDSFCIVNDEYILLNRFGRLAKLHKSLQNPVQKNILYFITPSTDFYGISFVLKYNKIILPGPYGIIYDVY